MLSVSQLDEFFLYRMISSFLLSFIFYFLREVGSITRQERCSSRDLEAATSRTVSITCHGLLYFSSDTFVSFVLLFICFNDSIESNRVLEIRALAGSNE